MTRTKPATKREVLRQPYSEPEEDWKWAVEPHKSAAPCSPPPPPSSPLRPPRGESPSHEWPFSVELLCRPLCTSVTFGALQRDNACLLNAWGGSPRKQPGPHARVLWSPGLGHVPATLPVEVTLLPPGPRPPTEPASPLPSPSPARRSASFIQVKGDAEAV